MVCPSNDLEGRSSSSESDEMTSAVPGKPTSTPELGNVSAHGFWILVDERELFLPFEQFPWFREAPIGALASIERPAQGHLRWPDLDIDLTLESIEHPERYPLIANGR